MAKNLHNRASFGLGEFFGKILSPIIEKEKFGNFFGYFLLKLGDFLGKSSVLDVMKPFKVVVTAVMLRRCQWRDFTCIITPPDSSVCVKYGRINAL